MAGAERKKHVRFAAAAAGPGLPAAPRPEVAVVGGGSWRCGRGGEGAALRWCISVALCAAFLGLVSAGGGRPGGHRTCGPFAAGRGREPPPAGEVTPPSNMRCRG